MSDAHTLAAGLLVAATLLSGCAAVPMPILANAGVNMAQTGTAAFVSGSMQTACKLPLEIVRQACLDAGESLQFKIRLHSSSPTDCTYFLTPVRGDAIRIRIIQHTPTLTSISIRVGLLGDQNLSRFLLAEIERKLPQQPQ